MCVFADGMGMAGNGLHYLTTNDWVLIQAKTGLRTFKLGEEIIREGDWIQSLYIIRRGEASAELAATGARAIVATLGPKDLCGDGVSGPEQSYCDGGREGCRGRSGRNKFAGPAGSWRPSPGLHLGFSECRRRLSNLPGK